MILIPLFLGAFYGIVTLGCSFFKLNKKFSSILIFSVFFSLVEYFRGFILGGFPWNLIAFAWTDYLSILQILSSIGTYAFNLLSITIFLIPTIILFNYKIRIKLSFLTLATILLITNFFYGSTILKSKEKLNEKNLNFVIKVISPKIEINRFFEYENPEKIVSELVELSEPNINEKTIFIFPEEPFQIYI